MNKICIIDARADLAIKEKLKEMGYELLDSIKCGQLQEPVSYHPDMVICKLSDRDIVVAPNVYDYYSENLKKNHVNVIKGDTVLSGKYPENIAYNVAKMGKFMVHNFKYTDRKILEYMDKYSYERVNVKQGYSKCSLAIVSENLGMTSDHIMCRELNKLGKHILNLKEGDIALDGYNYGFIGGATGNDSGKFFLSGKLNLYSSGKEVKEFLLANKIDYVELSEKALVDIGTLIFI